jgi:rhodanese-related sulfurtransferase
MMASCITKEELLKKRIEKAPMVLIDVRNLEEFMAQHISFAINIPLNQLIEHLPEMDKDKQYVTTCGKGGGRSEEAARVMYSAGFNAVWLCNGTNGWMGVKC